MNRHGADLALAWDQAGRRVRGTRRWKRLPLIWPLQVAVVAAFWGGCAALPAARAAQLGAWLGRLVGPRLRYHARVRQNLAMALPSASDAEIDRLAQGAAASLGATLAEYAHLRALAQHADLVISPALQAYARRGRPAIFVTAHHGNWEIPAAMAATLGMPLSVVYRQKDNPLLEWLIQRCRQPLGCHYVPSHKGARPLLGALRAGRSLALLVDLRVESGDLLPFFGRPAHTTLVPARLAQHVRCPLVPTHAERVGPAAHRVVIGAPIWPDPTIGDRDQQARAMMMRVNQAIESWIKARPQDWVSIHYRWPESVRTAALEERARRGSG
jgi:KDO2-lipid IV(A) lauroyltransferase